MGEFMLAEYESLQERVENLVIEYEAVSQIRDRRLFTDFLVNGHKMMTLSSVSSTKRDDVIFAKVCLGMIITLYDDLADNPQYYNPKLLKFLYSLNIDEDSSQRPVLAPDDLATYDLARSLFLHLKTSVESFPHYSSLAEILVFDIQYIFIANRYSELLTANPSMRNMTESRILGPYNMGMLATGVIDLMASSSFDMSEMGKMREFLIRGQRLGRIGNMVATYQREIREGDITNEIMIDLQGPDKYKNVLMKEFYEGLAELKKLEREVKSIDLNSYVDGLSTLYRLHLDLEGVI